MFKEHMGHRILMCVMYSIMRDERQDQIESNT